MNANHACGGLLADRSMGRYLLPDDGKRITEISKTKKEGYKMNKKNDEPNEIMFGSIITVGLSILLFIVLLGGWSRR